uniref:Uncharacterized protein n=1 Tax=Octopus bimaculoides TaxID=37653 RepID=A0A0L8GBW2_OCTBM
MQLPCFGFAYMIKWRLLEYTRCLLAIAIMSSPVRDCQNCKHPCPQSPPSHLLPFPIFFLAFLPPPPFFFTSN